MFPGDPRARCFACGGEMLPEMGGGFICPKRYMSPHTEAFMEEVGGHLYEMGVRDASSITTQQHEEAIRKALAGRAMVLEIMES